MASKPAGSINAKPQLDGHAPLPAGMDPVDRAYLARFTRGNEALEREVLELFAGQAPLYLQRLRAATTQKAWKDAAHTLKGAAAAVGARRVQHIAELAEKLDVETDMIGYKGYCEQAVAALEEAVGEVSRHIARLFSAA